MALLAIAIGSPQAVASTVSAGATLNYTADPGEANDVTVTLSGGEYTISDPGAPMIDAEAGCSKPPGTTSVVMCDATNVVFEEFDLGDRDDRFDASGVVLSPRLLPTPFTVHGGPGDDPLLRAGEGAFLLLGEEGGDLLEGGPSSDQLVGGPSDPSDPGYVLDGDDTLIGNEGDDSLGGGPGVDTLVGGPGNDFGGSGPGNDLLSGGEGSDGFDGGDGDDSLELGAGDDSFSSGGSGNDLLFGGEGSDFLNGNEGDDSLEGGAGDDFSLDGGPGTDILTGGDGHDTLAGGAGDDLLDGGAGNDAFENFTDDASGDDTVSGGPGDDLFTGVVPCFRPDCPANGAAESDSFSGGEGQDTADYRQSETPVAVSLDGEPNDGPAGRNSSNIGGDVERLVGGSESDTLIGGAADDEIDGAGGDDLIVGGLGSDTLEGGPADSGNDSLEGGPGDDRMTGGPGEDLLDAGEGVDTTAGGGGSDTLEGGSGSDSLTGGPGLDSLAGGPGDDTLDGGEPALIGADGGDSLDGGEGNDSLGGGAGPDLLDGGPGGDLLSGSTGRDTASFDFRASPVEVTLDDIANDGEAGEGDNVRSDIEAVVGGSDEDTLTGDAAGNILDGSSGEDYADGAAGGDSLEGGNARDTLRARDGAPDRVACGDDRDFAIVDRFDTLKDCEVVDRAGRHRARAGEAIVVRPTTGELALKLPGTDRRVPLEDTLTLPIATALDARSGEVRVTARNRGGRARAASFSGGAFHVSQEKGRRGLTEAVLRGGSGERSRACGHPKPGDALSASHRTRGYRRLASEAPNRLALRGRRSRARIASASAELVVTDRCDGTLTRVRRGSVTVEVFARGGKDKVRLRAGQKYLAPAPRRAG